MRQKVFSWVDKFTVKDENETDKYSIEGEFFSLGKKLHGYDMVGKEAAFIQQKVFSFRPRYFIFVDGQQIAEIVKEFTLLRPKYSIEGLGWEIEGSFMEHDYGIVQSDRTIVTIHKAWMSWGDCYELDIADENDEIIALSVVLAIDCVTAARSNSSNVGINH
jgi:uncharacterized protein YxjI